MAYPELTLQNKIAVVFAATGAIGSKVAQTLAREGAHVCISGRNGEKLKEVAALIRESGGQVSTEILDATDETTITHYIDHITIEAGHIDITFNAIGGRPHSLHYPERAADHTLDTFLTPLHHILGSIFLTSRAVGEQMIKQGHGSIITLSATLSGMTAAHMSNLSATCGAIEAMTRSLAGEYEPAGIRVNCVRASAMPETRTIQETAAGQTAITGQPIEPSHPPLARPITVTETANSVAYLASDMASGITAQTLTVCGGSFVD